eukprot:364033-Chlamydomonas_euryale.AAC.15
MAAAPRAPRASATRRPRCSRRAAACTLAHLALAALPAALGHLPFVEPERARRAGLGAGGAATRIAEDFTYRRPFDLLRASTVPPWAAAALAANATNATAAAAAGQPREDLSIVVQALLNNANDVDWCAVLRRRSPVTCGKAGPSKMP